MAEPFAQDGSGIESSEMETERARRVAQELNLNPFSQLNHALQRDRNQVPGPAVRNALDPVRNRFFRALAGDGEAIGGLKKQGLNGG